MTDAPSRHTLGSDLARYRESGDFAAQAETLMQLAEIAAKEDEYSLAQGLYGQAWALYEQAEDQVGVAKSVWRLTACMIKMTGSSFFWRAFRGFDWPHIHHLQMWTLAFCETMPDHRQRIEAYLFLKAHIQAYRLYEAVLEGLLRTYKAINDIAGQARTVTDMYLTISQFSPEHRIFIEQALSLYQQIDDRIGQAYSHYHLGRLANWHQQPEVARSEFQTAEDLFTQANDYKGSIKAFIMLGELTLLTQGYEAYQNYYRQKLDALKHQPLAKRYLEFIWITLAAIARKNGDFATAREAYHQALFVCVAAGQSYKQADVYWQWGSMEFHDAQRKSMGYALCQWAISLEKHYFPYNRQREHPFRVMTRQMRPHKRRD